MVRQISLIFLGLALANNVQAKEPVKSSNYSSSLKCIVRTTMAEGENQSEKAQIGIMYTIHNRAKQRHRGHCSIVNERNQFSHRRIRWNRKIADKLYDLASNVINERVDDVTKGATFFHDKSIRKNPFGRTRFTASYDDMLFYRELKT